MKEEDRAREVLAACPFCGGAEAFVERADLSSCYIICNDCSARGPTSCDEDNEDAMASEADEVEPGERPARRLWNNRAFATPSPVIETEGSGPLDAGDAVREALLPVSDWSDKLAELFDWTGSAWLSGEEPENDAQRRGECYSFLCSLIGYLTSAETAALAAERSTDREALAAFAHPTSATAGSAADGLREALEPFVREIDRLESEYGFDRPPHQGQCLMLPLSDLLRLRKALAAPDDITCAGSEGPWDAAILKQARELTAQMDPAIANRPLSEHAPARSEPVVDGAAEVRRLALEDAAKVAGHASIHYREPTDWDYGAHDACTRIAAAIRALPDHVGRVETGKGESDRD